MRPNSASSALPFLLLFAGLSSCLAPVFGPDLREDIEGLRLTARRLPPVGGFRDYAGAAFIRPLSSSEPPEVYDKFLEQTRRAGLSFVILPDHSRGVHAEFRTKRAEGPAILQEGDVSPDPDEDREAIQDALIGAERRLSGLARAMDPYYAVFSIRRTHLLVQNEAGLPDEAEWPAALKSGRVYYSFDLLADAGGFSYWAGDPEVLGIQGDEVALRPGLSLQVRTPVAGLIEILRDGTVIHKDTATRLSLPVHEPGSYRVQVSITLGGRSWPWIFSSPIRVRGG